MIRFIEDNILNYFARWGDLDSYKRQIKNIFNLTTADDRSSWHVAPDRRGFYAFPLKFIEPFLLSSTDKTQGKPVEQLKYHKFKLDDDKLIWSHLINSIPRNEIEVVRGDWALSTVSVWKKGLTVHIAKVTNSRHDFNSFSGEKISGGRPSKKFNHHKYDFDDFEVFVPAGALK